ncbi:hypothetical protein [Hydrogenophaga crocea]|uniref:Uncharacterized protein n=1 Tax=Hydrogenophaga crocea TaxID=2716225 RepID=A0A6G8IFR7_9BURK|nr:hypothetical protein [Hydrogenophaga crocea]QIM52022.1 hypothetical protein G9Q37_07665 [Hydrogenophaga crocea]
MKQTPALAKLGELSWEMYAGQLTERYFRKSALLAENAVDADLYFLAAHHFQKLLGAKGLHAAFSLRGGGGSQIDVEFARLIDEGVATLSVTDGDRRHPMQEFSLTSRRCQLIADSMGGIAWHYVLEGYACENLIPLKVFGEACEFGDRHEEIERLELLDQFCDESQPVPSKFLNRKNGLTLKALLSETDENTRRYWLSVIEANPLLRAAFSECIEARDCAMENCQCSISQGFGDASLKLVRDWAKMQSVPKSLELFKESAEWLEIGSIAFDVGVALSIQRI